MGYRSTVAYTIRFVGEPDTYEKRKKDFYLFLSEAKVKDETKLCFDEQDDLNLSVNEDKLEINFLVEDVKWYDDYPDVKCHEALMDLSKEWCDEDEDNFNPYIGGAFARIGEGSDDAVEEVWGTGDYDWVFVSRQVIVDWM